MKAFQRFLTWKNETKLFISTRIGLQECIITEKNEVSSAENSEGNEEDSCHEPESDSDRERSEIITDDDKED